MSILVLGVGNILLEDEGIGVKVIEALEQLDRLPDGVDVVDGGTCGMDLLDVVADREHLIIVDAVKTGAPPGTVVVLRDDAVPAFFRTKISPHQLGLSDLLAATALMERSPARLTLIGIVPERMGTGLELSPGIAAKLEELLALTVEELATLGKHPQPAARTGTDG